MSLSSTKALNSLPLVATETALERAEELAERLLPDRSPKRRMLVIVNPYATTVSDRLRNLVVYALQSRYSVEAIDTQERNHATEICREAARQGYDVVVAFGGDGTVNEAANGLADADAEEGLPAARQSLGAHARIPNDVVAHENRLGMARLLRPRCGPGAGHRPPFIFRRVGPMPPGRAWTSTPAQGPIRAWSTLRGLDIHPALPRTARTCAVTPAPSGRRGQQVIVRLRSFT